jgi:hypothetical protein
MSNVREAVEHPLGTMKARFGATLSCQSVSEGTAPPVLVYILT